MRARHGEDGLTGLFDFFAAANIEVAVFDEIQAQAAIEAYARFGKGLNPRARLNLTIVLPTPSPGASTRPCSSRVATFAKPTSDRCCSA
jgi:hypothetical protein